MRTLIGAFMTRLFGAANLAIGILLWTQRGGGPSVERAIAYASFPSARHPMEA